ncbi:hypothetical protein NQZ68_008321 [Dissostichus eleginoides]|nr:hypothetical protein NQZ68_008321 [Dissostichus eleginoides]
MPTKIPVAPAREDVPPYRFCGGWGSYTRRRRVTGRLSAVSQEDGVQASGSVSCPIHASERVPASPAVSAPQLLLLLLLP